MAWSNLANLFRGFSHDFCQLYNIKQIDFIFFCSCTVIDHRWRHSVWRTKSHALDCVSCVLFCSSHAMTSSVIYYSTDARKNEIYLLNNTTFSSFRNGLYEYYKSALSNYDAEDPPDEHGSLFVCLVTCVVICLVLWDVTFVINSCKQCPCHKWFIPKEILWCITH